MAMRPVDLQQVLVKAPDTTRDAAAQQQAAGMQPAQTAEITKRHAQRAETVSQFDEAAAVLIREREPGAGRQGQQQGAPKQQPEDEAEAETPKGAVRPPLGRNIDLSA